MPRITIDNIKDWPPERFEAALREAIESTSPVDALVATTRRLKEYERKYSMTTEEFYARFMSGELGDAKDFIGWAGMFEAFTRLKRRLEPCQEPDLHDVLREIDARLYQQPA